MRPIRSVSATVLEPASEYGRAAMDELHQQTVKLLSFQELPRQVYDTQVAFNTTPSFGDSAKFSLAASESRIRRHFALLSAGRLPEPASSFSTSPSSTVTASPSPSSSLAPPPRSDGSRLAGEHVEIVTADADPPTNLTVAGQPNILVRVRPHTTKDPENTRFWIWAGLDNLRFATLNALACALELKRLRPSGEVQ